MARLIVRFRKAEDKFLNVEADEFHQDGEFMKAYLHNELVAMFLPEEVRIAFLDVSKTQVGSGGQ